MILIQTSDYDVSTMDTVKWLIHFGEEFIRLNDTTLIKNLSYIDGRFIVELSNNVLIDTKLLKGYWYRRGEYEFQWRYEKSNTESFDNYFEGYITQEYKSLGDFFTFFLKNKINSIGDSKTCQFVNKNTILLSARDLGLLTPDFIITSYKEELKNFIVGRSLITKPIHSSFLFEDDGYSFPTYTELVTTEHIEFAPDVFKPTLFQECIEKEFEIRAFYLNGKFYSMAIFSQNNPRTKIDFRVYCHKKPNRNVPFNLPKAIEKKLKKLMTLLGYESGSIDLIYSKKKEFYFLEVNPIGQFGMVSVPCNYLLEKEIAKHLIKEQ